MTEEEEVKKETTPEEKEAADDTANENKEKHVEFPEDETDKENIVTEASKPKGPALVFGASGEQGRAVIEGLLDSGYLPVYGATRDVESERAIEISNMGAVLIETDIGSTYSVESALSDTAAPSIFLVTTTDMPPNSVNFKRAEEKECESIKSFFDSLIKVHRKDGIDRHVIFSALDNVEEVVKAYNKEGDEPFIQPLEDGSVVAHYSGKGRGGEYGLEVTKDVEGITVTLVTLPFNHSNFLGFAIPVPDKGQTEWTMESAFDDSAIDMFSVHDLAFIVPAILEEKEIYASKNIRVSAEKMTMYEVAAIFSDIFGKDVIYNPLTVEEMAKLPFPSAPAMAQMCKFLADPRSSHDIDITEAVMFPRKPQLFKDWLLTHSDHPSFDKLGLAVDASPILSVTVFGATGRQGTSVIKGLLADTRKVYTIRAATRRPDSDKAKAVQSLNPERITIIEAHFGDKESLQKAVDGVDGVFLVTDYYNGTGIDPDVEEAHAKNVIDACEASTSVKHLVFSTLESVEDMNRHYKLGLPQIEYGEGDERKTSIIPHFDAKARAAAYARTKKLSCTYVLMPVYSESFFELLAPEEQMDEETGRKSLVISVPKHENLGVMCMSVDELGPAVANIFDSYQVFAGHEIALMTDFVTITEVAEMIKETFYEEKDTKGNVTTCKVEKKDVTVDKWVEKRGTTVKDLGQMFQYFSKSEAVKKRRSMASALELLPDATPLKEWLEMNKNNVSFREKLGLR